jgi:large subunit ribosomal protein L16
LISHQINAALRPIRKHLKKQAKIWTFFAPAVPITKKPNEVRMGKGKGTVKYWAFLIKKNQTLFEFTNAKQKTIHKVVNSSKTKLPFKSTFLSKY